MTPLRIKLINMYVDWRDFGIRPWDRRLPAEEIPQFWKDLLRSFRSLENEVQQAKMKEKQELRDAGKVMKGKAPSPEAAKDYLKWRKDQIKQRQQQQKQHHTILEQQAIIRKQEYEKRQAMLASRKGKKPRHMRPKRAVKR